MKYLEIIEIIKKKYNYKVEEIELQKEDINKKDIYTKDMQILMQNTQLVILKIQDHTKFKSKITNKILNDFLDYKIENKEIDISNNFFLKYQKKLEKDTIINYYISIIKKLRDNIDIIILPEIL